MDVVLTVLAAAVVFLFAGHLLYSAVCAFSWKNFLMMDYGAYTNFLYNLAHGDGFRFLVEHNYLKTHLSFSFILLAPLVYLWDSPLLLIGVQWAFLMGGLVILWRFMRRHRAPVPLAAAILAVLCAYPMTQGVMLSEFHGVSAYFLLLPGLLYTLSFHRKWAWLPLLVLLGLREDAGIVILPMLLYFAARDRWKPGFLLAALAAAYVVFAVFVLYPRVNGVSLFGVRAPELGAGPALSPEVVVPALASRARALGWFFLPAVFLCIPFRRAWIPLLVFPSAALLQALASAMTRQHSLAFHYSAPAFSALACALAVAASSPADLRRTPGAGPRIAAAGLLAALAVAHGVNGFFLGGGAAERVYARFHPQFHPLLRLARSLPKDGLLLCNQNVAPFFSLRPDIMVLHYFDPRRHQAEYIVTDIHEIQTPAFANIADAVENGAYGLVDQASPYLVLKRGYASPDTARLVRRIRHHQMVPALMAGHGGQVVYDPVMGLLREWTGVMDAPPVPLAFGRAIRLPAGLYQARFTLRVPATAPPPATGYGTLSVHLRGQSESLAEMEIGPTPGDAFADQILPFTLPAPALVEPRIFGAEGALQIRAIRLEPAAPPPPD